MSLTSNALKRLFASACRERRFTCSAAALSSNTPAPQPSVQSHNALPPAKMRALISLYHQAETWITPENLLQRIDEAFVPEDKDAKKRGAEVLYSTRDLKERLERIRHAPKMIQWGTGSNSADLYEPGTNWSDGRRRREIRVMEALYGVDHTVPGHLQPGLEILEESGNVAKERHTEDSVSGGNADVSDLLHDR